MSGYEIAFTPSFLASLDELEGIVAKLKRP